MSACASQSIRLGELVEVSQSVREASSRLAKRDIIAALFRRLSAADLRLAASYLAGEIPQGPLQIGWSALQAAHESPAPAPLPLFAAGGEDERVAGAGGDQQVARDGRTSPLTLAELDSLFDQLHDIAGAGSQHRRVALLAAVLRRASEPERRFMSQLLLGELRQGALRALVVEALAQAYAVDDGAVRRALMFAGRLEPVLDALARHDPDALAGFAPTPMVPIEPMLAVTADDLERSLTELGEVAVEWKLDGVRVQIHRAGDMVRVFSRRLRDISVQLPWLRAFALALPVARCIIEGEVVMLDTNGRPMPFQQTMSEVATGKSPKKRGRAAVAAPFTALAAEGRTTAAAAAAATAPRLRFLAFDLLLAGDRAWVDAPYRDRRRVLEELVPARDRVPSHRARTVAEVQRLYEQALAAGHEGVLLKALDSPYQAGRRGAQWRKLKPVETLDLVILAAEWGHGRRRGRLSNLHLGARVPESPGRFLMLGKTFKGLTDAMLGELTAELLAIETGREGHVVHVRPERVVEIAFDGIQRSPRYDSGLALRFARVVRFRFDKSAGDASTIDEVRAIHARRGGGTNA